MRLLGISILLFLYSFHVFCQCGKYLDYRFKADSCYRISSFQEASYYYKKCLNYKEKQRVDYYYLAVSLMKINKNDSALYFYRIAAKEGLRYTSTQSFYDDDIVKKNSNLEEWKKTISIVKKNTERYIEKVNLNSEFLKTILEKKSLDKKYRDSKINLLSTEIKDSLWKIQKQIDIDNQQWLKKEIKKNGWPKISKVGAEGDMAAGVIVQHADNDTTFQRYCLSLLKKLWKSRDTSPKNIANLEDRLLINSNKMQIYGTQYETIIVNHKIIDLKLKPTVDITCLNKRRVALTMEPVEIYLESEKKKCFIKENAIKVNQLESLNDTIYNFFSDFKLIMVGEMHGTIEPAKFTIGLAQVLTRNGDSVQLGLEIPAEEMAKFISEHSDSSIYSSEFFMKRAIDGRENYAWAELISTLNKNKKVKLFFFDINKKDYKVSGNRDSLMYIKIKNQIQKYPNWKIITLSGNIHNMIKPFRGNNTMGCYIINDHELNLSDKLCSINHCYNSGTMYNDVGNGLELRQIQNFNSIYSTSVDYENYLFLYPKTKAENYNGIYFTRYVTAAKIVNE